MKIKITKILAFLISTFLFLLPAISTFADIENFNPTIKNPLGSSDLNILIQRIMNVVSVVGGIVVVVFIIYSGYKFVMAGGNEAEHKKAREIFYGTIIGGAILLGADIIANIIIGTVESTTGVKLTK